MHTSQSEFKKILGILGILLGVAAITAQANSQFIDPYNLQNLIRWTGLFGILSLAASFVIITGGIDLSIGSLVSLVGCLLPIFLIDHEFSTPVAVVMVLGISGLLGLFHGLLITKLRLQPFVVTLCGLLLYRGLARFLTDDQTKGFGNDFDSLRSFATGRPFAFSYFLIGFGALVLAARLLRFFRRRKTSGEEQPHASSPLACLTIPIAPVVWLIPRLGGQGGTRSLVTFIGFWSLGLGIYARFKPESGLAEMLVPTPFLIMSGLAAIASFLLTKTVWGRYVFAIGRNESAARYSGIRTDRTLILAYVACSFLSGVGGILFALDVNSIQPAVHGNFYELFAIAAAVLGGCSLRGGEGSIMGVLLGTALLRVLYNSINMLKIPTQLEFAIIGAVILIGVAADEVIRRLVAERKRRRELKRVIHEGQFEEG